FDYLECELLSSLLGLPREGDSLVYDVSEKIPQRRMRDSALASIVDYDALERRRVFRESKVECEVCMDADKLGAECTRLSGCEHVFCHECLREALKYHMADGVTAGTFRCLGCNSLVDLHEVKEFATPEQYERYDELLLQRSLSMMEDVVRCPRAGCSGTCLADDEYLARCPVCQHSFCPRCLRPNHRGTACKQEATVDGGESDDEEEEEDDADDKDEEGRLLWRIAHEQDPAKRMLLLERQVLVLGRPTEDVVAFNRFRKTYRNRCPTCRIFVEKVDGCNSVFCPICNKEFIYGLQEARCQPDPSP
uniref:RBR-type E3 ubiquitin transferase n=1 Tax=Mesocestoides corti TaxID=53468 RepID=A0A5K3FXI3_MESCO